MGTHLIVLTTQRDLFNEYQHDRVKMIFILFCALDESNLSKMRVNEILSNLCEVVCVTVEELGWLVGGDLWRFSAPV